MTAPPSGPHQIVRRQATTGWVGLNVRELWRYRELVFFYTVRDLKVRYKQTLLGAAWAVLQPVATMVVFSLFLGRLPGLSRPGSVPYPLFTLCGLVPWQLFSYALTQSSLSLVQDAEVVRKVYFPRLILPLASVMAGVVDFTIAFLVLLCVMAYYRVVPNGAVVMLPIMVALTLAAALAVGLWLSALNVRYRDVRYAIPFLAQIWLLATPVAYPDTLVPDTWRAVYALNPMAGVVQGFRWTLLRAAPPTIGALGPTILATAAMLAGGVLYFRRTERHFADVI